MTLIDNIKIINEESDIREYVRYFLEWNFSPDEIEELYKYYNAKHIITEGKYTTIVIEDIKKKRKRKRKRKNNKNKNNRSDSDESRND